jgi:hypothetical protein
MTLAGCTVAAHCKPGVIASCTIELTIDVLTISGAKLESENQNTFICIDETSLPPELIEVWD